MLSKYKLIIVHLVHSYTETQQQFPTDKTNTACEYYNKMCKIYSYAMFLAVGRLVQVSDFWFYLQCLVNKSF